MSAHPKPVDTEELMFNLLCAPKCVNDAFDNLIHHGALQAARLIELELQLASAMSLRRRQQSLIDELVDRCTKLTHALEATDPTGAAPAAELRASEAAMNEFLQRLKKGSAS